MNRSLPHCLAIAALLGPASALALEIEPGRWTIETVTSNPFTGERANTQTECLTEEDLDPERFQQDMGECEAVQVDDTDSELRWSFECVTDQASGRGEGRITSAGDSADGEMRFVMDMSAMGMKEFVIETRWSGERVGECR